MQFGVVWQAPPPPLLSPFAPDFNANLPPPPSLSALSLIPIRRSPPSSPLSSPCSFFFFQAEGGIRGVEGFCGVGEGYKRPPVNCRGPNSRGLIGRETTPFRGSGELTFTGVGAGCRIGKDSYGIWGGLGGPPPPPFVPLRR